MAPEAVESVDEALERVVAIQKLVERARRTPGLYEGHVARLRRDIERLISETSKPSRGKHRELVRGANDIAGELVTLRRAGTLAAKYVRLLDRALVKLRRRDFGRAHDALRKLDGPLDLVREIEEAEASYGRFRGRLESDAARLDVEIARLEAVPKPDLGQEAVAEAKARVADLQRALDLSYTSWIHRALARESLPLLVELARLSDALVPPPKDAMAGERLVEYLRVEGPGSPLRAATVWQLREASELSEAKFAYVVGEDPAGRLVLRENIAWLAALSAPGAGAFRLRTLDSLRPERFDTFRSFLRRDPEGLRVLDDLAASMAAGTWDAVVRSARVYDLHGEVARKRWDGTLADEVERVRARRDAVVADLKRLPPVEDVIPPSPAASRT